MKPNENFNSGRFMQYLAHDLKRCVRKAGLTTFACSLAPAIILVFTAWTSDMNGITDWKISPVFSDMAAAVISTLFFLRLPVTCYGHLTDKRKGAVHLMLPASHAEKYASMALVSIVIFPLAFALMYLSVDALCSVLFQSRYENALAIAIAHDIGDTSMLTTFFMPWMTASAGMAGAVLFKKNKGAKTFFTAALSFIALLIILRTLETRCSISFTFPHHMHVWHIFQAICTVLLMTYTYFKTKKIEL